MNFLQAILLGIVQGLTEFLPISSSAHLVIVPYLLNWTFPEKQKFVFDVLVQVGTLLAVIIFFWKDLISIMQAFFLGLWKKQPFTDAQSRLGWLLILATIPAGLIGLFLKEMVEAAFNSPVATALSLYGTAILLVAAEYFGHRTRSLEHIHWLDALWIGLAQAISIFPGISRSGATITGGMLRQLDRPAAARFSFLMSIPIMLAAGLLSTFDLVKIPGLSEFLPVLGLGFVTSAVVGYFSIRWLLSFLIRHSFKSFVIYCASAATLVLLIALIRSIG